MLSLLIKKQFKEAFHGLFVNQKTGKERSKAGKIGMAILFALLYIFLGFSFFGMSMLLTPLFDTEFAWIVYGIFGIVAVIGGTFISMFSTSSVLYKAKDNDLLLSLPIKPGDILFSRMALVTFLSTLYSGCVFLPIIINGWIHGVNSVASIIFSLLSLLSIGLLVSALSCVVGFVVAYISSRSKNKSLVTILSSLLILGVYYFTSFKLESAFTSIVENSVVAANNIKNFGIIFYYLAIGCLGDFKGFIIFAAISIALFVAIYLGLSKSFLTIATRNSNVSVSKNKKVVYSKQGNAKSALLKKEFKHFLNVPVYLMNCGLGVLLVIIACIALIINRNTINLMLSLVSFELPILAEMMPLILGGSIMAIISMDMVTTPSISLEGKNLWILKTLPIKTYEIFESKERLHVLFNGIPTVIGIIVLFYFMNFDFELSLYLAVALLLAIDINALSGLVIGVLRPNFTWTNENQPVKQSLNTLISMLLGWLFAAIFVGAYYLLRDYFTIGSYLTTFIFVEVALIILLRRWIRDKGCKVFEKL